jgi:hypothetical protein
MTSPPVGGGLGDRAEPVAAEGDGAVVRVVLFRAAVQAADGCG